MHGGPAIEVDGLTKTYGETLALDNLSLSVAQGEVFALLGPNGAGKTTAVEILEGYRRPDSGETLVLGRDPQRSRRELRSMTGVMLQEGGLYPGIRVGEALRLFTSYYRDAAEPAALIDRVGLSDRARASVRSLSTGERQRLSLALAIVGRPKVAFLDEPTAGMDPRGRSDTWDIVRDLRAEGATVLVTTHLLEEAERLADRIAIIDRGRLVAAGRPAELGRPANRMAFRTDRVIDTTALAGALGAAVEQSPDGSYEVPGPPAPERIARLAAWLESNGVLLTHLDSAGESLEDLYLRLTAP
ncbi:MAG: ABC transporter ATP-binding protein [Actinomycetota bacterium]